MSKRFREYVEQIAEQGDWEWGDGTPGMSAAARAFLDKIERLREECASWRRVAERLEIDRTQLANAIVVDCSSLHHDSASRHEGGTPCPVEARVRAALEKR